MRLRLVAVATTLLMVASTSARASEPTNRDSLGNRQNLIQQLRLNDTLILWQMMFHSGWLSGQSGLIAELPNVNPMSNIRYDAKPVHSVPMKLQCPDVWSNAGTCIVWGYFQQQPNGIPVAVEKSTNR